MGRRTLESYSRRSLRTPRRLKLLAPTPLDVERDGLASLDVRLAPEEDVEVVPRPRVAVRRGAARRLEALLVLGREEEFVAERLLSKVPACAAIARVFKGMTPPSVFSKRCRVPERPVEAAFRNPPSTPRRRPRSARLAPARAPARVRGGRDDGHGAGEDGFEEALAPGLVARGRQREPRRRESSQIVGDAGGHGAGLHGMLRHDPHGLEAAHIDRDVVGPERFVPGFTCPASQPRRRRDS